jgi:hypothetical protein
MKRMCALETMAQGGLGTVEFCRDCQVVHVSLEGVTLHFKPAGFREFCLTLAMALNRFDFRQELENSGAEAQARAKEGVH